MSLRGLAVLFFGLVFLLPVASLPSLAPSSSIMPIACASILPTAHVQNAPLERPALGCAASAPRASVPLLIMAVERVCIWAKIQIETATLSLAGSGDVDIGTAAPTNNLHVYYSGGGNARLTVENGGAGQSGVDIKRSGGTVGDWVLYSPTGSQDLRVYDGNSGGVGDTVTFQKGGNVGIGTTAPANALDVNGNADATAFYSNTFRQSSSGAGMITNANSNRLLLYSNTPLQQPILADYVLWLFIVLQKLVDQFFPDFHSVLLF